MGIGKNKPVICGGGHILRNHTNIYSHSSKNPTKEYRAHEPLPAVHRVCHAAAGGGCLASPRRGEGGRVCGERAEAGVMMRLGVRTCEELKSSIDECGNTKRKEVGKLQQQHSVERRRQGQF